VVLRLTRHRVCTHGGDPVRSLHDQRGWAGFTYSDGLSDRLGEFLMGVPEQNFGRPSGIRVRHL
jgi:hypothetical protein